MSELIRKHIKGPPNGQRGARGFTLVELVAVVLIITIFAALAIPSAVMQMRDRRVQESARQIALVFRQARLRAMGRGSAVMVRFGANRFTVHEARLGAATAGADCADLPVSSCVNTLWAASAMVDGYGEAATGEMSTVVFGIADSANNDIPEIEICFTPMGRAFVREAIDDDAAFAPLAEAYVASVSRPGMTGTRQVALMPNGTARLSAR
jgi:type IV fimbrial biogenesis protein FimT